MSALILLITTSLLATTPDFTELDQKLAALEQERLLVSAHVEQTKQKIAASEQQLARSEHKTIILYSQLRHRLLAYKSQHSSIKLAILTKSAKINDFLRRTQLLHLIARHDQQLLNDLKVNRARLATLREEQLINQKQLAALNSELARQEDELAKLRLDTIKVLLAEADNGPNVAAANFAEQKGLLPWPLTGELNSAFGKVLDKDSHSITMNHGLELSAASGAAVTAIADGTVLFSGPVPGYQQVVIIDHGLQYISIYGQLSRATVAKDEQVETHKLIGLVAPPAAGAQPALYFELRYKGAAIDPLPWLKPLE